MKDEKTHLEITAETPSLTEIFLVILRTSSMIFLVISYILGYAIYMLTLNLVVALCMWMILFLVFLFLTSQKTIALSKKYGPTRWTITKESITTQNQLMTIIISTEHFKQIKTMSPGLLMFQFKQGLQARILKTSEEQAQHIISFFAEV